MTHNDPHRDHEYHVCVPDQCAGMRLDQILAHLFPQFSRSKLQQWIKSEQVLVDGAARRGKDKLLGGESIALTALLENETAAVAEDIPIDIVYEDDALIVINKTAGMVVHPAVGNRSGTLQNALLFHFPALREIPRAGIVHRLDKDTTGLMVVARTLEAHTSLVAQLQARTVKREYLALVSGELIAGKTINEKIGRHAMDRKKMAVTVTGKEAITHYRIEDRFNAYTLVRVNLETGRTHQIRVHFAHVRHPLLGDQTYGGRFKLPANASDKLKDTIRGFRRQALHATALTLIHPVTQQAISWDTELPADYNLLIQAFKKDRDHVRATQDDNFDDFDN